MVPRATPPVVTLLRRCILFRRRSEPQRGSGRCWLPPLRYSFPSSSFHATQDSDLVSCFGFPPVRSPFRSTTGNRIAWFGLEPVGSSCVARDTGGQSRRSEAIRRSESRMVRKLDLHEDAMVRDCGSAVAIMGFEYAERDRPFPVYADRCFRVAEPPPTAGH